MNPEELAALKANVQKLVDAGAPEQDINDYIEAAHKEKNVPLQGMMGKPITEAPEPPANPNDISGAVAKHVLNAAQGIPGMEALEAGAGMLGSRLTGNPMSFQQSLDALRGQTATINPAVSAGEKIAGSLLTLPFLPENPAAAGAILGGADQALSADHPGDPGRTALGAVGGALIGKGADLAVGAGRSLMATSPATNLLDRQAARAASAKRLYGAAIAEGKTNPVTPEIQSWLQEPDIAEIVGELQKTRPFKGVSPESPEMLDAVYKTLSDRAATLKKGLQAVTPNRPNIGRFQANDIKAAQATGLTAMDTAMPTYREAVKDFAQHKAAEDAVSKGYDAVRAKLLNNLPTAKNLTRTTPEAFEKWAESAGPDETKAAVQGVLGATKMALKKAPLTKGRKALMAAPSLLRAANDQTYLPRFGLLAIRNSN